MFRSSVISIINLSPGLEVQGCVTNVTTFGAFVDIGVEVDALVPIGKFPRPSANRRYAGSGIGGSSQSGSTRGILQQLSLRLGDRVRAKIDSVKTQERRIALKDVHLLCDTQVKK